MRAPFGRSPANALRSNPVKRVFRSKEFLPQIHQMYHVAFIERFVHSVSQRDAGFSSASLVTVSFVTLFIRCIGGNLESAHALQINSVPRDKCNTPHAFTSFTQQPREPEVSLTCYVRVSLCDRRARDCIFIMRAAP